jgi:hypothetical protein
VGPLREILHYSIVNGRIVPADSPHGFHPFASRHFFLRRGDVAGTFEMFGGCSYEIESDQIGLYLHTECEPGDTDPNTYTDDIRPNSKR